MEMIFKAGYNRQTVNPDESIPLTGFSNEPKRFHTAITEDICVSCVALSDGETTVLMMGCDICTVSDRVAYEGRALVSKATGVPEDRIYIAATHTHSAPGIGRQEFDCIKRYTEKFFKGMVDAAVGAIADLLPARMFTGSIETEHLNFIKHYWVYDPVTGEKSVIGDQYGSQKGKILLDHTTKVDPTMHLVKFAREGKKDIVLCNFRAHPHFTGGYKKFDLSSDYIGAFRMALEPMLDCYALYLQGACGNVNSSTRMTAERRYSTCRSYGLALAATAAEGLAKYMTEVKPGKIKTKQITFYGEINHDQDHMVEDALKVREVWAETYDRDLCVKVGEPYGIHGPYHAWGIVTKAGLTTEKDGWLILNAIQISEELAFVTYPGEMYDSISVRMEENSPYNTTLMLGYCYHHKGYLPSMIAYKYGSYEVDVSRFRAGTGERVADAYVKMLTELKEE